MSTYHIFGEEPSNRELLSSTPSYRYSKSQVSRNRELTNYTYNNIFWSQNLNNITYPLKVTNKSITQNSFTIINEGTDFPIQTYLLVESRSKNKVEDNTAVSLYFKINSNTLGDLSTDTVNEDVETNKTHLVFGAPLNVFTYYGNQKQAIVEYPINPDKTFGNPSILQRGSFPAQENIFSNSGFDLKSNSSFSGYIPAFWTSSVISVDLSNINTTNEYAYSSVPLESVAKVVRSNTEISDLYTDPSDEANISLNLSLTNNTINITGGSDYVVGDSFTVTGGAIDATIKVTEVGSNGSILTAALTYEGSLFTSQPVVNYDGVSGNGANISYNNTFRITGITVNSGGNGYSVYDKIEIYRDVTEEKLLSIDIDFAIKTKPIGVDPKVKNKYSIGSIEIVNEAVSYTHLTLPTKRIV